MKSADLHKVWGAPDNSRLTAKQQSFRLPTHVAAKIDALCDIYPTRTKTEIVGDLLAAALEDLIPNLPSAAGAEVGKDPDHGVLYEETGLIAEFRLRANKHFKDLEKELGNKEAAEIYASQYVISENDLKAAN